MTLMFKFLGHLPYTLLNFVYSNKQKQSKTKKEKTQISEGLYLTTHSSFIWTIYTIYIYIKPLLRQTVIVLVFFAEHLLYFSHLYVFNLWSYTLKDPDERIIHINTIFSLSIRTDKPEQMRADPDQMQQITRTFIVSLSVHKVQGLRKPNT